MYMLIENPFLDLIIYILVFYSIFTNMKKKASVGGGLKENLKNVHNTNTKWS